MTSEASPEEIAAATAYENLFVQALFAEWPPHLLAAAGAAPGDRLLDVACGTGILAREAASRVGPAGTIAGVDPNAGMLSVAAGAAPEIEWRRGTAEELPFDDASFDVVASQFGLMFFADRLGALREMRRVLRPGGRLVVAVWDSLDRHPGYAAEVELLDRFGGTAAGDALRAPFVLGERAELDALFAELGAGTPSIETRVGTARFPDIRTMVEADLRGWLPVMGVFLSEEQIDTILRHAETHLADVLTDDGVRFASPAHVVSLQLP